ncbi:hypothetical protein HG537_0H03160 [Torulaspora globosa]|uniref:Calcofluor white hypersensitive protein n=1 Tax=Torulaspora globosa TaxID=48254 RepID=A0A7H9HZ94_9SACH|nr:hypothetical protein HG537_0H03160 [Torulaspora sp. CBS 2947]
MVTINGKVIPLAHTVCAFAAFFAALATGYSLHFHKIVQNAHYGYPDEWFPSVSATIGDRYPERSIFQILIALTSFPRFLLLLGHFYLNGSITCLIIGVVRTVTCGGWVYITSTDDHDIHDVFMITYIVLTLPWDIMLVRFSTTGKLLKGFVGALFFGLLIPLIYWFIKHQVEHIPGAYSIYAYFEWSLIILDILFDSLAYKEFDRLRINLRLKDSDDGGWLFQICNQIQDLDLTVEDEKSFTRIDDETTGVSIEEDTHAELIRSTDDEIEIVLEKTENVTVISQADSVPCCTSFLYILTNTLNSFLFWTAVTSLTCSIWYFPLWYMGISGYEAAMLYYLAPLFLYIPMMPTVLYQYGVLLGGLIVVGAHLVGTPEARLLVTGVGTAIIVATFVLNLKSIAAKDTNSYFSTTWLLGLVLSVVIKMGCYSNNPLWPIMNSENGGYNLLGLLLAAVLGMLSPYTNSVHFSGSTTGPSQSSGGLISEILIGFGFGSLIFGIHQLLTDASTVIYWSWEGYDQENQGPLSWPWSGLTCLIMLGATLTSHKFSGRPFIPAVLLALSTAVLCDDRAIGWNKYVYGGLVYVTAMIWFIPTYFSALAINSSIFSFALSSIVYIVMVLAHVWVVAYAFVPLGWILRERIWVVLTISTSCIIVGSFAARSSIRNSSDGKFVPSSKFSKRIGLLAMLIVGMIASFTYHQRPTGAPEPYHPDSKVLTAGIWTIHFGLDNDMWSSEESMIFLMKEMQLDVVGLLETDTQRIVMGNRDLTSKLGHELNMYADYGPGPNKHTWGCILLSKFPIVNSTHHLMPSPDGELAPAIHATIKTYDDILVDVFVFHGGQEEDVEDRRLQSEALSKLMGSTNRPSILLSYLVTNPLEGNYNTYVSDESGMHDIDPEDDDRWCQYILYKNLRRTGYARVSRGKVTDTELQVGKFQVLNQTQLAELGDKIYDHEKIDDPNNDDLRFPDKFFDEGERGHRYHVFDKPLYYSSRN